MKIYKMKNMKIRNRINRLKKIFKFIEIINKRNY